ESFRFIVDSANANGVDMAPIIFALRVLFRVAIDLARAGEQEASFVQLGQSQCVVRPQRTDLQRWNRVAQIIDRTGGRGEMENIVNLAVDLDRVRDVVAYEAESRMRAQRFQVALASGDEIVDTDDLMPLGQKAVAKMRPENPCTAGDDRPH